MTPANPPDGVQDALGRRVPLTPLATRICSLVPSITECLFDLGAGSRVVGCTEYCVSPAEQVAGLPRVGGPRTCELEAVARQRPDLVLADAEENDREQVTRLMQSGVRVYVTLPNTLPRLARFLKDVALLLGTPRVADPHLRELEEVGALPAGDPVDTACLIWREPYMTASSDTFLSAVLAAAGAHNVFGDAPRRYPRITLEELARRRPRVVLLPSDPYVFSEEEAAEIRAAVPGASTLPIPGEWVTWYGCRTAGAIRELRGVLEPFRG